MPLTGQRSQDPTHPHACPHRTARHPERGRTPGRQPAPGTRPPPSDCPLPATATDCPLDTLCCWGRAGCGRGDCHHGQTSSHYLPHLCCQHPCQRMQLPLRRSPHRTAWPHLREEAAGLDASRCFHHARHRRRARRLAPRCGGHLEAHRAHSSAAGLRQQPRHCWRRWQLRRWGCGRPASPAGPALRCAVPSPPASSHPESDTAGDRH
mmetsp:Transcript_15910/g.47865  ORF Transcript_15910/g.47865 Transcript_15910/m.47865 type:complete len:208 (-) Transcript_15910:460-1083(-)